MCIKIINITDIRGFGKFALFPLELSGTSIFSSAAVSDEEWLHETSTLLVDLSVFFLWDALSLKDLGNLLFSWEINLTDLNFLTLSKRSFAVHFSSLSCSLWQMKLEDLKGTIGCEGETSCLSLGRNNNILPFDWHPQFSVNENC